MVKITLRVVLGPFFKFKDLKYLLHVDLEGPVGLALGTGPRLHLLFLSLVEGAEEEATPEAVVLDHAELGEDARAAGDHTTGPDELVQVELSGGGGRRR